MGIKKVELVLEGNKRTVRVKGHKKLSDDALGYNMSVDEKKKTYKITKIKGKELDDELQRLGANDSYEGFTTNSTGYMGRIAIVSEDPPDWDLAETKHGLYWTASGTSAYFHDRELNCWAANPSPIDTHWYKSSCKYTGLSTIDGGRTITSSAYASYYNYDFWENDKRTDITHDITIHGYYSGGFDYYWDFTETGEGSYLLDTNAFIY